MRASSRPTHAGGVVYRISRGAPRFLLVTARRPPYDWVYPKGHIEAGETAEEAAVREVHEEAGVRAAIVAPLDEVTITIRGQKQVIRYFLMKASDKGTPGEGRQSCWLTSDDALQRLLFPEARASLRQALDVLERTSG